MEKLNDYARKFARLGGLARAAKLTKEELAEIGRKGGEAARGKPRKKMKPRAKKNQRQEMEGTE